LPNHPLAFSAQCFGTAPDNLQDILGGILRPAGLERRLRRIFQGKLNFFRCGLTAQGCDHHETKVYPGGNTAAGDQIAIPNQADSITKCNAVE